MFVKYRKRILYTAISLFGTLGFYRGTQLYKYNYNKNGSRHFCYTNNALYGLFATFLYVNPVTFPIIAVKEIYRLEINVRGLDELKNTDEYYALY
jgi:hypothetical protein